jgi:hypothetical protein
LNDENNEKKVAAEPVKKQNGHTNGIKKKPMKPFTEKKKNRVIKDKKKYFKKKATKKNSKKK